MDTLIYFGKSGLIYSVLYGFYYLFFRNNTNFQTNRAYLVLILPLSFLLPILNSTIQVSQEYLLILPTIEIDTITTSTTNFNWEGLIVYGYMAISSILLLLLIKNLYQTITIIHSIKKGVNKAIQPFSFFSFIHVSDSIKEKDRNAIMLHEKVHSEQWHSADILLYEISKIILWWNPLLWIGLNTVKGNHEFIADKLASVKADKYSSVLVAQLLGVNCSTLANNFKSNHLLKKRIMMMKTKTTNKLSLVKYVLVIPIIAVALLATAQEQINPPPPPPPPPPEAPAAIDTDGEIDTEPQFKGGMDALIAYMGKNVKYPAEAKKNNIEGKVFIAFLVDDKGNIKDPKVMRSAHKLLDAEALRVIKAMPQWIPGQKDGKNVAAKVTLPISFKNK